MLCSSPDYLLELLVLHAYQEYMASAAKGLQHAGSSDAAALEAILRSFLELTARLPGSGVISIGSWLYNADTALQVVARPDLAQVLRPPGFEQHPIVLDPADPTHNVAAAVTRQGLDRLADSARAALGDGSVELAGLAMQVPQIQQQIDAMCLHHRILTEGGGTWDLIPKPVSSWLPNTGMVAISTLTQDAMEDFKMHLLVRPLRAEGTSDESLMGIELRLASNVPLLKTLSRMPLPISLTIRQGSSIEVSSRMSKERITSWLKPRGKRLEEFASQKVIVLERDIVGKLTTGAGPSWMLSREQLYTLGLCASEPEMDLVPLNAQDIAGCKVKFSLKLDFN